jgi:nitrile hydratase
MNGVHDMGGMQDFGPVLPEANEPVFHARWEGRMYAMAFATGAWGKWNLDVARHAIELVPAADYLSLSYYHKWYAGLTELWIRFGLFTRDELNRGRSARGSVKVVPPLLGNQVAAVIANGAPKSRDLAVIANYHVGQSVRARNINPPTHTRLPRYARGKRGVIERDHGVFVFPDTNSQLLGEKPQHVYSVRFAARELWGEKSTPQDLVYLDLWDDYLEPA